MKAFNKLLVAEFKQFFRDKTALFFTFLFPSLFMLVFGLAFGGQQDVVYDIGLINEDDSAVGAGIAEGLHQIPAFTITDGELDDMLVSLEEGDLRAVVVIPANLEASLASGQTADVTVYYDPSDTNASPIILSVLSQAVNGINLQLTGQPALLQLAEESIQSQQLRYIDYLVPGILGMSLMFLGLYGGLPMVEWREKQVLKRFGATPLRRSTMIFSQITYRMFLALLQAAIIIAVAFFAFDVQMTGSWFFLIGLTLLGSITFVSIGYFAVARVKTTEGAMPIINIVQFPMLFLSGIFFPIEFFPDFMKPIVEAIPLTYLGDALRQVMVDATPAYSMGFDILILAVWLVITMVLAIKLFRWE